MSKKGRIDKITAHTGMFWGLVCIVPFGWIFFVASIIRRKNDVTKYGTLNAKLALIVLRNYIVSYTIIFVAVMIFCINEWTKGRFALPNLIAVIVIPIVYNVAVSKILTYEEKRRGITNKKDNSDKPSKEKQGRKKR